jgi:hypothetical protein
MEGDSVNELEANMLLHPCIPEILTVPARSPVKPVYVKAALKLIDRLSEEE